jgi:hypothetical protein
VYIDLFITALSKWHVTDLLFFLIQEEEEEEEEGVRIDLI